MTMPFRFAVTSLLLLALVAPFGALAAGEPSLALKRLEGRTVILRYEHLDGATLTLEDAAGREVKGDMRFPEGNGVKTVLLPRGINGGKYVFVARDRDGKTLDTLKVTLTYTAPTCTIRASDRKIEGRGMVSLRWASDNARRAVLFGSHKVRTSGTEKILLSHPGTHQFVLNLTGQGGVGSCSTSVRVTD